MTEETKKSLVWAAAYCSKCEHCVADVREKLREREVESEGIDIIIDYLLQEKYIDHSRYASFYVRDKFRFNGWGKLKIANILREKRIESGVIHTALELIDEESYTEKLKELLSQKSKSISSANPYYRNAKLYRFALSRGFEASIITSVLRMEGIDF